MQIQSIGLSMFLCRYLNDIMEVSNTISFEADIHLDGQPSSQGALHIVVTFELGSLWLRKLDSSHSLRDIPHCHGHLIVLVHLDI